MFFVILDKTKLQKGVNVKPMSYSNLRDEFKAAFALHVSYISKYFFTLRSGGATAAAKKRY